MSKVLSIDEYLKEEYNFPTDEVKNEFVRLSVLFRNMCSDYEKEKGSDKAYRMSDAARHYGRSEEYMTYIYLIGRYKKQRY